MSSLYQEVYGRGEPMLMLHGWGMHSGVWRRFARRLATKYRVMCVDLPGHGRSPVAQPLSLENLCDRLSALIGDQSVHLLGWSLGATIAIALASATPNRISSLSLVAGNPRFVSDDVWPGCDRAIWQNFSDQLQVDCQATLSRFVCLLAHGASQPKLLIQQINQSLQETAIPSPTTLSEALNMLATADLKARLTSVDCPLLTIFGALDPLVPDRCAAAIQTLCPSAKVAVLAQAGHVPFLTHERDVLDIIIDSV